MDGDFLPGTCGVTVRMRLLPGRPRPQDPGLVSSAHSGSAPDASGPRNPEKSGERGCDSMTLEAIRYSRGSLQILDQLLLPQQSRYEAVGSVRQAWEAIRAMKVASRGGAQVGVGVVPLTAVPDVPSSPSRCAAPQPLPSWAASASPWSCRRAPGDLALLHSWPSSGTR